MELKNILGQKVIVTVLVDDSINLSSIYGVVAGVEGTLVHLSHVWRYNARSAKCGPTSINMNALSVQSIEVVNDWSNHPKSPWD